MSFLAKAVSCALSYKMGGCIQGWKKHLQIRGVLKITPEMGGKENPGEEEVIALPLSSCLPKDEGQDSTAEI